MVPSPPESFSRGLVQQQDPMPHFLPHEVAAGPPRRLLDEGDPHRQLQQLLSTGGQQGEHSG
jgi:hypothetical protein